MLTNNRTGSRSLKRLARIVFLSSFAISPASSLPQAVDGKGTASIKVQVISNLIVMPGYINNSDKLAVVLDTGASENVLLPELALKLNLHPTQTAHTAGIGKGQDETMHISSGARFAWGDAKQMTLGDQNIAALPIDYISQQTGQQVDAIFGSSLFHHFRIRVDYEHSVVTFSSGSVPATNGTPIPITFYGNEPYIEATFETVTGETIPARFLIDSGTAGDLILSRTFLDAHPSIAKGHVLVDTPTITAVGGSIPLQLLRITSLDIGPFHLIGPVAAVPSSVLGALGDHDIAGFIGAGILSRFTINWDYAERTMTLTPNHQYGEPFEADASGMRLVARGPDWKTIQIAATSPGGPAAIAGLQAGDVVIAVNRKAPPPLYVLKKLLTKPGSAVSFTVSRSGKESAATIHLRRLV